MKKYVFILSVLTSIVFSSCCSADYKVIDKQEYISITSNDRQYTITLQNIKTQNIFSFNVIYSDYVGYELDSIYKFLFDFKPAIDDYYSIKTEIPKAYRYQ